MDELSIKVSIANRVYPLKINRADEERVRKAAKLVSDRIKEYEEQFAGSDKFDHLAMCAMHFASELVNLTDELPAERQAVKKSIGEIDLRLSEYLKRINVH